MHRLRRTQGIATAYGRRFPLSTSAHAPQALAAVIVDLVDEVDDAKRDMA